ncbi:MAG: AMIN domain-containing protein, partial [Rickettsiales bacterium]
MNPFHRLGILTAVSFFLVASAFAATPEVTKVRIGVHPGKTRLVLEMTEAVSYRVFLLGNPYRVVIDLPDVSWRAPLQPLKSPEGVIANYRFGLFRPGNSRVVIDVTRPVAISRHALLDSAKGKGSRFFIDIKPIAESEFEVARATVLSRDWREPAKDEAAPSDSISSKTRAD